MILQRVSVWNLKTISEKKVQEKEYFISIDISLRF
jgi:hypothetical protein